MGHTNKYVKAVDNPSCWVISMNTHIYMTHTNWDDWAYEWNSNYERSYLLWSLTTNKKYTIGFIDYIFDFYKIRVS